MYDTAIREAGIVLESRLRETTASISFGQSLIEEYYKLISSWFGGKPGAIFNVLPGGPRAIFKVVR